MSRKTLPETTHGDSNAAFWVIGHLQKAVFSGILIPLVFFIFLSYYNIMMYLSNYYTIFDLGLAYRTLHLFITTHSLVNWPIPHALVTAKPYTKLIYVPLSLTLLIYHGPTTFLVDMIAAVSAGGYAIFRIFKFRTSNIRLGLLAQLLYFLYPATYGLMAHGGNFMIFFTPFLLISYMFYLEEKPFKSGIFAFLAMLTFSFGTLLVPLFYLTTIFFDDGYYTRFKTKRNEDKMVIDKVPLKNEKKRHWRIFLLFFAFIIGIAIFLYEMSLYSLGGLITAARLPISGGNYSSVAANSILYKIFLSLVGMKATFFFNMLYPFLFAPLLSPYSVFILPFFLLLYYANYYPYYNVSQQYPSMVNAIIFVGFSYFLKKNLSNKRFKKFIGVVLIASVISFLTMSPFSISNFEQGHVMSYSHVTSLDIEFNKGLTYIPINSSVFIQNNVPQLMDRASIYMPGNYSGQVVDFAVIVPPNIGFPSDQYSGYNNTWALFFKNSSSYGLYIYIQGISIYKFNYYSSPIYTVN